MTMTPWNLTHGQWSKKFTMATDILESVVCGHDHFAKWWFCGQAWWLNQWFTILTIKKVAFQPWLWSKWVVLWLNFVLEFKVDHFDHRKFARLQKVENLLIT